MPLVRPLEGRPETAGEIIVVDNGSTDRTIEIAREFGAKVFVEEWKGYAAQKNSAIEKASCEWVLSLDADEAVSPELQEEMGRLFPTMQRWRNEGMPVSADPESARAREEGLRWGLDEAEDAGADMSGYFLPRKNLFLRRWIKHAGFYPDAKLRLFRRGKGRFVDRPVHEVMEVDGPTGTLNGALLHYTYPTLSNYIATMNRYSSLGAEIAVGKGHGRFSLLNIVVRPVATFMSMYLLRAGFLDGREGLLLCLYHSVYVSWKYAKAWELEKTTKA